MQKNYVYLLIVIFTIGICSLFSTPVMPNGSGAEIDPFVIANLDNLEYLSTNPGLWDQGFYFIQTADIDATDTQNWDSGAGFAPIGSEYLGAFIGQYDGQGHTISNLVINRPGSYIGIFGWTLDSIIQNLGNVDGNIVGAFYVGGIIGFAEITTVENCFNSGAVNGQFIVGGIIGYISFGSLSNCYNTGPIYAIDYYVGGCIGFVSSPIINCYNTGTVIAPAASAGFSSNTFTGDTVNCFWNIDTSVAPVGVALGVSTGVTGASNEAMQTLSTFTSAGWDFVGESANGTEDVWDINPAYNNGYPYLSWQTSEESLPTTGELFFSEVSDNLPGEAEGSGYIEIYNLSDFSVDLSGYEIRRGDNTTSFVYDGNSYTLPEETTIDAGGFLVIGNGYQEALFMTAWGLTGDINYLSGDSVLGLTSGYAYQLWNPGTKAGSLDETPNVDSGEQSIQEEVGTWTAPATPANSTPGEPSGGQTLPVQLSSFTAIQNDANLAQLEWTTQSESNISGYNVYRNLTDSNDNALMVNGVLIPGTNTHSEQNYSFIDEEMETEVDYYYWLESVDFGGSTSFFYPVYIRIENPDEEEDTPDLVYSTGIKSIYPNPFNPSATIAFSLKDDSNVKVSIFNVKGELIQTLADERMTGSNDYVLTWDGKASNGADMPSGIYFFKLDAGNQTQTSRAVLLK